MQDQNLLDGTIFLRRSFEKLLSSLIASFGKIGRSDLRGGSTISYEDGGIVINIPKGEKQSAMEYRDELLKNGVACERVTDENTGVSYIYVSIVTTIGDRLEEEVESKSSVKG